MKFGNVGLAVHLLTFFYVWCAKYSFWRIYLISLKAYTT